CRRSRPECLSHTRGAPPSGRRTRMGKAKGESPDKLTDVPREPLDTQGGHDSDKSARLSPKGERVEHAQALDNAAAIVGHAVAFGLAVPRGFVFESGQLFYAAGQLEEVRLAGILPDGRGWARRRMANGAELPEGPVLRQAQDESFALDPGDENRDHMSAKTIR